MKDQLRELQQKLDRRGFVGYIAAHHGGELAELLLKSDALAAFQKGTTRSVEITVPASLFKTAILNATGQNQPLVPSDRRPGIVTAPQRRFTIRTISRHRAKC